MITITWKVNGYKSTKCMGCEKIIPREDFSFRFSLGKTGIFHICEGCATMFIQKEVLEKCKEGYIDEETKEVTHQMIIDSEEIIKDPEEIGELG